MQRGDSPPKAAGAGLVGPQQLRELGRRDNPASQGEDDQQGYDCCPDDPEVEREESSIPPARLPRRWRSRFSRGYSDCALLRLCASLGSSSTCGVMRSYNLTRTLAGGMRRISPLPECGETFHGQARAQTALRNQQASIASGAAQAHPERVAQAAPPHHHLLAHPQVGNAYPRKSGGDTILAGAIQRAGRARFTYWRTRTKRAIWQAYSVRPGKTS